MDSFSANIPPSIAELFGAASPLSACLDGFAPRPGQAAMAEAIAQVMDEGANLVVEAGTGTGKTLAYLIPALLSGRRVILSTGTKTLQDQLFHRDLPMVTAAIGRPARTVQLKGRSNYLCLHRLRAVYEQPQAHHQLARELKELHNWSLATRTGDIVEVDGIQEDSPVWPQVTSTLENCLGNQCELYDSCHVVIARQAALAADIVVVNHHLLLADLVLKDEGFGELLPGCEAVIIDEAHQFPDIAQGFFNVSLGSRRLFDLASDLRSEALHAMPGDTLPARLADALVKAVRDVRLSLRSENQGSESIGSGGNNLMWDRIDAGFFRRLDECIEALDDIISWLQSVDESLKGLQRCRERACAAVDSIELITTADETAGLRWVGLTRLGFVLNYTPMEVADNLRKLLDAQACSWIFTSATLTVADDFSHFLMRMGLEDPRTLMIPSPFDFSSCGLLYLPQGLPEPADHSYTVQMLDELLPLLDASEGRAFILFTSHRALREAAGLLRQRDDFRYPLLVQGEAARSKLLEQFAERENPVLLGTSSFWEGVDMRGDRLVLVVIDKLPFASPGDPMLKAKLEAITRRGGKAFNEYQLPQAVLGLKQGVGRLIRDHSDYGVVVICDPRMTSKGYGKRFLASLPSFPVTQDAEQVMCFFDEYSANSSAGPKGGV
ncbi:MAG: ATP-dependent DNA helicase [Gammaproteobacteria bacterium]|nr:ATP-dependent DNA helicase [Gammaproteobacteria bacterium]MCP4088850.1 ATP-dependent DNA helicase [Gammaproteobacteria bacterium]MCP4274866.1 ATP-dependent DNA helicase [Gammaproteobacteria bacterium]MCP4832067.1 ATP-dependent DNA helicase [Gammaproteobacteria bacterium]MCP4928332.1 ATP-dependent DNA helicase [Gammaproteobacteria bacterium]